MHNKASMVLRSAVVLAGALACSDLSGLGGKQELPAGTPNPNTFNTAAGALSLYQATLTAFQFENGSSVTGVGSSQSANKAGAFVDYVIASGVLSDELQAPDLQSTPGPLQVTAGGSYDQLDARVLPEVGNAGSAPSPTVALYSELQGIRGSANLAIGALAAYDSSASPALSGQMYALKGYAEVMLADLYCSGVPLSTLDFHGDFTYHPGSTTAQIYRDAIAQFDTAIGLSADSSRILNLARVGKGRALLDLGLADSAALAVTDVPDEFTYQFLVDWSQAFGRMGNSSFTPLMAVASSEGGNGLPYLFDGASDPRVATGIYGSNMYSTLMYAPAKYGTTSGTFAGAIRPITVADWIEARLIKAEAALADGQITDWIAQLNYLREHAITPALPDIDGDTVNVTDRVGLMFKERAYWLFVTGHRQGDMRRLVRQYHLSADQVYPTGPYPPGSALFTTYGTDVTAPVPTAENSNPLFSGCLSRGA